MSPLCHWVVAALQQLVSLALLELVRKPDWEQLVRVEEAFAEHWLQLHRAQIRYLLELLLGNIAYHRLKVLLAILVRNVLERRS